MFTGIVDHCGQIQSVEFNNQRATLWIQSQFDALQLGESISIDGVCLTITETREKSFACELSPETLRLTTAKNYVVGARVNLERALQLSDRLGGHFVFGHVDQTLRVSEIKSHQEFIEMHFAEVSAEQQSYLNPKGSVAINGVSLTINSIDSNSFSVMLIPHTLNRTNLASLQIGQLINIEFDFLAKTIVRQLQLIERGVAYETRLH